MNNLSHKLQLQLIIISIVEKRYSDLKYIYDEYRNDNSGTFNPFMIDLMHLYRTCIVIDLCKLLIVPNTRQGAKDKYKGNSQNSNFYFTINEHKHELHNDYDRINSILINLEGEVSLLTFERDKELAHKDISTGVSVKMHLNYMKEIQRLILSAREISGRLCNSRGVGTHKNENENQTLSEIINFLKFQNENIQNKLMSEYMSRSNKF